MFETVEIFGGGGYDLYVSLSMTHINDRHRSYASPPKVFSGNHRQKCVEYFVCSLLNDMITQEMFVFDL